MTSTGDSAESKSEAARRSQAQFGANASQYRTSKPHAKGASLKRMVELAETIGVASDALVLDIATGAGHVARVLGPHVGSIVVSDITLEMLDAARSVVFDAGVDCVTFAASDAHNLGFSNDSFDVVTCRIAPHHFVDPAGFVAEAARVTKPGGTVMVIDNIAPEDGAAAQWCDDFERRRDVSHVRCLALSEWNQAFTDAGLVVNHVEEISKLMDFVGWADNMSVDDQTRVELLQDLSNAPSAAAQWLRPVFGVAGAAGTNASIGAGTSFVLTEGIIVAQVAV